VRRIEIGVKDMPYNPLDGDGYQRLDVGDRVEVTGDIDKDLFDRRYMNAESIIMLRNNTQG
jgi:hypothetical protein